MGKTYITPSLVEVDTDSDIILVSMTDEPPTIETGGGELPPGIGSEIPSPSRRSVPFDGPQDSAFGDNLFGDASSPF